MGAGLFDKELEQKEELLEQIAYDAEKKIVEEIFEKSSFEIHKNDFYKCVNIQLERYTQVAKQEGYDIKKMTKEDFAGKIPVASYHELLVLLNDSTWEYIQSYLAGKYLSETISESVDLSKEEYERQIQEYAKMWKMTIEYAKKENTFEEFKIQQYQSCFYNIIQEYCKNKLLKEKK